MFILLRPPILCVTLQYVMGGEDQYFSFERTDYIDRDTVGMFPVDRPFRIAHTAHWDHIMQDFSDYHILPMQLPGKRCQDQYCFTPKAMAYSWSPAVRVTPPSICPSAGSCVFRAKRGVRYHAKLYTRFQAALPWRNLLRIDSPKLFPVQDKAINSCQTAFRVYGQEPHAIWFKPLVLAIRGELEVKSHSKKRNTSATFFIPVKSPEGHLDGLLFFDRFIGPLPKDEAIQRLSRTFNPPLDNVDVTQNPNYFIRT
ncbi:hypothetical protein DSO57_1021033 [Entomophthora muscae]|uniref:Uncharacterized protein n=1 Tax=Entomophthora muscae TaxID=34485 RepID=A0ACC2TQH7_9FUNG|nr:hypothetical protein DSO57_1021033 [Entomophthora muscae]